MDHEELERGLDSSSYPDSESCPQNPILPMLRHGQLGTNEEQLGISAPGHFSKPTAHSQENLSPTAQDLLLPLSPG